MKLTAIKHILGSCFIQLFFRKSVCVFILRVYGLKIIIFVKTYLELKVNFSIETMINRNRPQLISWKGGRDSFPAVLSAQQDHLVLQSSVAVCTLGETWPWGGGGLGPAGASRSSAVAAPLCRHGGRMVFSSPQQLQKAPDFFLQLFQ